MIRTLEDLIPLSEYAEPSIRIVRKLMQFDSGHDETHLIRVTRDAIRFGVKTVKVGDNVFTHHVDLDVLIPACILHDLVNYPKNHPLRSKASYESGKLAVRELEELIPFKSDTQHVIIWNAIESHSWSAGIEPTSLEGQALQDADRIEALGRIGIARLFSVGGSLNRALWHPTDPLAKNRELDELAYTLDHVSVKLGKLHKTMKTDIGKEVALNRTMVIGEFIKDLMIEMDPWLDISELTDDISTF